MKNSASKLANYLLNIKAVKLQARNPFVWASGIKAPIYCDNRQLLSYPEIRTFLKKSFVEVIKTNFPDVEYIAGVATGAIAIGVLVADVMELPFVYVRPKPKEHGLKSQIEGYLPEGKKVVVIEDLISTGKSSLSAVEALRKNGANVLGMVAIFSYLLPVAEVNFEQANCKLLTLSDYNVLLKEALQLGYIDENELKILEEWRKEPENWWKK